MVTEKCLKLIHKLITTIPTSYEKEKATTINVLFSLINILNLKKKIITQLIYVQYIYKKFIQLIFPLKDLLNIYTFILT